MCWCLNPTGRYPTLKLRYVRWWSTTMTYNPFTSWRTAARVSGDGKRPRLVPQPRCLEPVCVGRIGRPWPEQTGDETQTGPEDPAQFVGRSIQEGRGLPHRCWTHQVLVNFPLGDLVVVHRELFALFFGKEVDKVAVRTATHGLAHDVVLLQFVGCFPQCGRQRIIVSKFFAAQGVGVALFHTFAWI